MPVAEMALEIFKLKGYVHSKNITQENIQRSQKVVVALVTKLSIII
jgi:hypothetical protein